MNTISQNLDLRQSQSLVMTPQLQQAIKLLQLNNMELSEFVDQELENNPFLERDTKKPEDDLAETPAKQEESRDTIDQAFEEGRANDEGGASDFDAGSSMANIGAGGNTRFENVEDSFENRMSRDATLREHLEEQVAMSFDDPRDRLIAGLLIDRLDESGYLRAETDDLAERLTCSPDRVERLLSEMKSFDPTGVFAKDLSECLALQLEERGQLDAPMRTLLDNLHMLADHAHKELAELCGVNDTYLKDMVEEIQALNPKPAADFEHLVVQTVVPDVVMKRLPKNLGGGWRVELNNETLPRVLVNQTYYKDVAGSAVRKEDKSYISNQLASANWLVRALDQRAQTILKVAGEIVEQQEAFFNYGIEFLKPLILKDIASEIEMHESTVSRVTTNKYIGTPRGLFELKFFFSTALGGEDGGTAHAAEAVKARIKSLIDAEDPKKILSDDKIVALLKDEGIDIARRTVAKYREAMHIPSSVQRRKMKKNL